MVSSPLKAKAAAWETPILHERLKSRAVVTKNMRWPLLSSTESPGSGSSIRIPFTCNKSGKAAAGSSDAMSRKAQQDKTASPVRTCEAWSGSHASSCLVVSCSRSCAKCSCAATSLSWVILAHGHS